MRRIGYRYQRTLARKAEVSGVGFLTGATIRLQFHPAPPSSGVVFLRGDLRPVTSIPACVDQVTGTQRRTTLGQAPIHVSLVEHVLASLSGLRIDNCIVELNGPEPPGLDGSALGFVAALREAGAVLQTARREIWTVDEPIVVSDSAGTLTLNPPAESGLKVSYILNYGSTSPIDRQLSTHWITPESFANEVAGCRTFILESEATELRRQGLGARVTTSDLLVFGKGGPIGNHVRFANEPARHKILDVVGDLSLLGHDLHGHIVAYRTGHPHNIEMVRELRRQIKLRSGTLTSAMRLAA